MECVAVSQFRGCILRRTHLKTAYVTAARQVLSHFEGSFECGRDMQPSFPGFEGRIGWILHGPTYPNIHCALDAAAAANIFL